MSIRPKPVADLEVISKNESESFRWHTHDFPCAISRWNYHPEYEIHLIRESHGKTFVGDYIGEFSPGYLTIVGPNIPHNWVPEFKRGQVFRDRDVVLQFHESILTGAAESFPEIKKVYPFLERAKRGLEFYGVAAMRGAELMEAIGRARGLDRLLIFLNLLQVLSRATEVRTLVSVGYAPNLDEKSAAVVHDVVDYILRNPTEIRMGTAAKLAKMSESTFCRFFKKMTGNTFVDFVRKIRISQACRLLSESSEPITSICYSSGFANLSNFNRTFLHEKGMTPSEYRRTAVGISAT